MAVVLLNYMLNWMDFHQMQDLLQMLLKKSTFYSIFCYCTGMAWIINSFPDKIMMLRFGETHLAVFFAKTSYQKYNARG